MRIFFTAVIILIGLSSCKENKEDLYIIRRGNVAYDFTFAELAIKYLETDDADYLRQIAKTKAAKHLLNHARHFDNDVPINSELELVEYLLSPKNEKKEIITDFKRNLEYVKSDIAEIDVTQKVCLEYLPNDFHYSSNLFFTFGYDLGVVYHENASVNLAHPRYLANMNEIKYYSIHELHHAGFVKLKDNFMPSLDITNYKEMSELIEYYTHLEGMGTFAPLAIRKEKNAMNVDADYLVFQDLEIMRGYEDEFFRIYFHFKNNPTGSLTEKDWDMLSILSDKKRLWYRIGTSMAQTIDKSLGRNKLVGLISEPSENFIKTYLMIKDEHYRLPTE